MLHSSAVASLRRCFAFALVLAACLFAGAPSAAFASCIPSQEDLAAYEADGTLEQRQAYQHSLGNDSFDDDLVASLQSRQSTALLRSKVPSAWAGGMPTTGSAKILALRVAFPAEGDEAAMGFAEGDSLTALQGMIDGSAGTAPYENLNAYYLRSSYGALSFSGKAYDYTAQHARSYYTNNVDALFTEAVTALAQNGVDVASFDGNNDKKIDGVYLHFAGGTTGWGTTWWSNQRHAGNSACIEGTDVSIDSEILLHEPANDAQSTQTIIHETGHALGLPDYYPYSSGSSSGINTHDMMFDNTGDQCAFSKWVLGWISNSDITRVKVASDGVWVKRGHGEPEHFDGSVDEALQAMNLGDAETGGFIAVSGDNTSSEDGRSFDIFDEDGLLSSFYLLQFDKPTGNQGADFIPEDGALRMYRVQAELDDEGSNFLKSNAYGANGDKLIEALNFEGDGFNALMEGTSVTPFTSPSTNFFESLPRGYTGISVEYGQGENEGNSVTLSYAATTPIDPSGFSVSLAGSSDVQCIDSRTLSFSMLATYSGDLNIDPYLEFDDNSPLASVTSEGGEIRISWALDPAEFTPGKKAELVLPEGLFILGRNSSGVVYAPEVRIPLAAAGSESMLAPESTRAMNVQLPSGLLRAPLSNALTQSDGTKLFFLACGSDPDSEESEPNGCLLLNRIDDSGQAQCSSVPVEGTGGNWLSLLGVFQRRKAAIEAVLLDDDTAVVCLRGTGDYDGSKKTCVWVDLSRNKVIAQADLDSYDPYLFSCQGSLIEASRLVSGVLLTKFQFNGDGSVQKSYALLQGADGVKDAARGSVVAYCSSGGVASGMEMKVLDGQAFGQLHFSDSSDDAFDKAVPFSDLACAHSLKVGNAVSVDAVAVSGDSLVVASHDASDAEGDEAPLASCIAKYPFDGGPATSCAYENRISSEYYRMSLSASENGDIVASFYLDRATDSDRNQPCELMFFDSALQSVKYSAGYGGPCGYWRGSTYTNLGFSALTSNWEKADWLRCDAYNVSGGGSDPADPTDPSDPTGPNPASGANSNDDPENNAGEQGTAPSVSARTGDSSMPLALLPVLIASAGIALAARKRWVREAR